MGFELRVARNDPLTGQNDLTEALRSFLKMIGYLPESSDDDIAFKLMRDCLLEYPKKPWTIDELLTELGSSKSTLYRYLNKLKGLDIVDEVIIPLEEPVAGPSKKTRKGYRIRFSSISLAWSLVESHTKIAMENYRSSVDHIDHLVKSRSKGSVEEKELKPSLTVDGIVLRGPVDGMQVLLVRRKYEPYKGSWAFPGGFLEYGERAEDGVLRELKEETGIDCYIRDMFTVASSPDRDPRGHTVSVVFLMGTEDGSEPKGMDDAKEASWFDLDDVPDLAFDHSMIMEKVKKLYREGSPDMVQ